MLHNEELATLCGVTLSGNRGSLSSQTKVNIKGLGAILGISVPLREQKSSEEALLGFDLRQSNWVRFIQVFSIKRKVETIAGKLFMCHRSISKMLWWFTNERDKEFLIINEI